VSTATPLAPGGAAAASLPPDAELRRLLWLCRRGMKELDVLLGRYAALGLPQAAPAERASFARLLALPDPLLAAYLLATDVPADPALAHLVRRIRALCRSAA
jgi:antitoxin CptB